MTDEVSEKHVLLPNKQSIFPPQIYEIFGICGGKSRHLPSQATYRVEESEPKRSEHFWLSLINK